MKKNTEENTGKKTEEQLPKKEKKWRKKSTSLQKNPIKSRIKKEITLLGSLSDVQDFTKDAGAFKKDAKEWSSKQIETLQTLVEKLRSFPEFKIHFIPNAQGNASNL